ncbi:MAG: glycosyltransferase family 2 protein [Dehalococcoidia bacterium]|nr:MAG: glycosyltransferase family 2 protein [Dehalococcoidia bacterium]
MTAQPFISIVMPCLNEELTVGVCVQKARNWLEKSGRSGEVLVVDNGSVDRSPEIAQSAGARLVYESKRGYGAALRRGFSEARGEWIVMGDCDDTYDFSDLEPLVRPLEQGADIAMGDRYAGGMAPGAMTWSHRYIGTPVISMLLKMMAGAKSPDSQCGLRAMRADALRGLELRTDGMELASEMLLKASRRGLAITNVPITYGTRVGEAKLNTIRDGWRHLRYLLLASPNYLFTLPGLLLVALGAVLFLLSLPRAEIVIGGAHWQPVFAGGIFFVVGINALLLGFVSRLYTTVRGLTNDDRLLRFYRRYLGFEVLLSIGFLCALVGAGIDIALAVGVLGGISSLVWAGIAQSFIISGANIALVGAMASLLELE